MKLKELIDCNYDVEINEIKINSKEIEEALRNQQNSQKSAEQKKKEAEALEKRKVYLQSFMTKDAIERCNKNNI